MNQELFNHLNKESTEKLFYNFKHDGLLDFEKKIISGKILYLRNYNLLKLKEEKSLIVESIKSLIRGYISYSAIAYEKKRIVIKSILEAEESLVEPRF